MATTTTESCNIGYALLQRPEGLETLDKISAHYGIEKTALSRNAHTYMQQHVQQQHSDLQQAIAKLQQQNAMLQQEQKDKAMAALKQQGQSFELQQTNSQLQQTIDHLQQQLQQTPDIQAENSKLHYNNAILQQQQTENQQTIETLQQQLQQATAKHNTIQTIFAFDRQIKPTLQNMTNMAILAMLGIIAIITIAINTHTISAVFHGILPTPLPLLMAMVVGIAPTVFAAQKQKHSFYAMLFFLLIDLMLASIKDYESEPPPLTTMIPSWLTLQRVAMSYFAIQFATTIKMATDSWFGSSNH